MKRIVNFKRFIISNMILFVGIFVLVSAIINSSYSCTNQKYKTIYAEEGDTLWSIASVEKGQNEYYRNKDVRDIVINLKKVNNLEVSDLKVGQKLIIPIN